MYNFRIWFKIILFISHYVNYGLYFMVETIVLV